MARNEQTSKKIRKVASKLLRSGAGTKKQIKSVAGSALTQSPSKKSRS